MTGSRTKKLSSTTYPDVLVSRLSSALALSLALLTTNHRAEATELGNHYAKKPKFVRHAMALKTEPKSLQSIVDAWVNRPELSHSLVGVEVVDADTGAELAQSNAHRRFTPASTLKTIVTACDYEKLGPNFVYTTSLVSNAPIEHGIVHGDLLLKPSQDPTLGRDDLRSLALAVKEKGIKKIEGRLLLDEPEGGGERFLGEWLSEDWAQDWMPVSSSLVVDRNISSPTVFAKPSFKVHRAEDADSANQRTLLKSEMTLGWLSFDEKEKTTKVFQLNNEKPAFASRTVANPDLYNLALMEDIMQVAGLKIEKKIFKPDAAAKPALLAGHQSMPLAQIIRTTLHESDNLFAQQLLRTLAFESAEKTLKGSLEDRALLIERRWLASFGVPADEVVLWDGCGLSRKDLVSPHILNMVVRHMYAQPALSAYIGLLKQGSIKPSGDFQFKTGAMDSVRGIVGLMRTGAGKRFCFAILVNGHTTSVRDLRTSIDLLINLLAR
jgi:D-alanyl-D-alanine carboxypeptidase/D-alanyl-D-alanine-endopeptidase (penicillin-binding protein 4)